MSVMLLTLGIAPVIFPGDRVHKPEPEKYPATRDALKRRSDRIVDVVVVQRPSMTRTETIGLIDDSG